MLPGVLETGILPSSQLRPSLCTSSARDGRRGARGALCTDTTLAANATGPAHLQAAQIAGARERGTPPFLLYTQTIVLLASFVKTRLDVAQVFVLGLRSGQAALF